MKPIENDDADLKSLKSLLCCNRHEIELGYSLKTFIRADLRCQIKFNERKILQLIFGV